jgi:hypothetical protein
VNGVPILCFSIHTYTLTVLSRGSIPGWGVATCYTLPTLTNTPGIISGGRPILPVGYTVTGRADRASGSLKPQPQPGSRCVLVEYGGVGIAVWNVRSATVTITRACARYATGH